MSHEHANNRRTFIAGLATLGILGTEFQLAHLNVRRVRAEILLDALESEID